MHEHQCRACKERFTCPIVTHCKLNSFDPNESKRPVCPTCWKKENDNEV